MQISMDLERLCSQDFNDFTSSQATTRATVRTCTEPAHRSIKGAVIRLAHNQIISGLLCTEPPVPRVRTNPGPYCARAQEGLQEPIGATRRQYAEPLPVRLVNTTLELTILLLE